MVRAFGDKIKLKVGEGKSTLELTEASRELRRQLGLEQLASGRKKMRLE